MSKMKIWITILLMLLLSLGAILIVESTTGQGYKFHQLIDETKQEKIEGIDEIVIETSTRDIKVLPSNEEDLTVVFKGKRYALLNTHIYELSVIKESNIISIKVKDKGYALFSYTEGLDLIIYVPKQYQGNLKLTSNSGDVYMGEIRLNQLEYKNTSGDLTLNRTRFKQATIKSTSGDLEGSILEGDLEVDFTSGDVELTHFGENFDGFFKTISGDLELAFPNLVNMDFVIQTISGDIEVDLSMTIAKKNRKQLLGYLGQTGINQITIETTSGDIEISRD